MTALPRLDYVNGVVSPYSYFTVFFGGIVLILVLVYLKCREPYLARINSEKISEKSNEAISKSRRKMSMIQVVLLSLACLLANIMSLVIFLIRQKSDRAKLLIPGIRNILFIPSALILSKWHNVAWHYYTGDKFIERYDFWQTEYLWYALVLVVIVLILFSLLERVINKN